MVENNIIVSIVIPVFNQVAFTKQCLESLAKTINQDYFTKRNTDYEVVIVDNASTDETASFLNEVEGSIKVIHNTENQGFSIACNQGVEASVGKYIVLLNNDTTIFPNWLESLIDFAETHNDAGAVGSKMLYPDGRLQEAGGMMYQNGKAWLFGMGDTDPNRPQYNTVCEVDYCSGASLLVRRDLWDKLGGLDAATFSPAYYEETDLCFGIRSLGYKVYYNPASVLVHYGQVTSSQTAASFVSKYLDINREKFVKKWASVLSHYPTYPSAGHIPITQDRNILLSGALQTCTSLGQEYNVK